MELVGRFHHYNRALDTIEHYLKRISSMTWQRGNLHWFFIVDVILQVVPTVGMTVTTFSGTGVNFSAFDMSGQGWSLIFDVWSSIDDSGKYRNLWDAYYAKAEGIMFVVDSTDRWDHSERDGDLNNGLFISHALSQPWLAREYRKWRDDNPYFHLHS